MKLNRKAYTTNMTARPYFKLQPEELKEIESAALKYLGDK